MSRRGYLDWLRGVAVLIMIEAHTLDAWTRVDDRGHAIYTWAIVIGGYGAPLFLLLAGVALALACGARVRRGRTEAEAAALARRRAWQIFGLAFLFRLQSWLISGGDPASLLKVDILNIMGLSLLAAAVLWGLGRTGAWRAALMLGVAVAMAMLTPVIRGIEALAALPDALEMYLRPVPGRTSFALFPWGGFLLAGGALGLWLDTVRTAAQERRLNLWLAVLGPAVAAGGYAASFLPPLYEQTSFWTSSPTFFFLRLGILVSLLPLAYAWATLLPGRSWIREFGLSSLFVYWIHVEMAYGVVSTPLHRQLPLWAALLALAAFTAVLFGCVKLKERFGRTRESGVNSFSRHRIGTPG